MMKRYSAVVALLVLASGALAEAGPQFKQWRITVKQGVPLTAQNEEDCVGSEECKPESVCGSGNLTYAYRIIYDQGYTTFDCAGGVWANENAACFGTGDAVATCELLTSCSSEPPDCAQARAEGRADLQQRCGAKYRPDGHTERIGIDSCDAMPKPKGGPVCEANAVIDPSAGTTSYAGQPVDVLFGSMWHAQVDFEDPIAQPFDLSIRRRYQSRATTTGLFGHRWFSLFDVGLEFPPSGLFAIFHDEIGQRWRFIERQGDYREVDGSGKELVREADGSHTLTDPSHGRTYRFSPNGKVTKITNSSGQDLNFAYDPSGDFTLADPLGRTLAFTVVGGVVEHVSWNGATVVTYEYTSGELTKATYSDQSFKTYTYEPKGGGQVLLTKIVDEEGREETSWDYDGSNRATISRGRGGREVYTFDYSTHTVTDGYGKGTSYTQNPSGVGVSEVSGPACPTCGDGPMVSVQYDPLERVQSATDRRGATTSYDLYDERGNPGVVIEAVQTYAERTTTYEYHPSLARLLSRRVQSVVSPAQYKETIWDYDADGNSAPNEFLDMESPRGQVHARIERGLTRDINGNTTSFESFTTYGYDGLGRLAAIDGPRAGTGDTTSLHYDPATGGLATIATPAGTTTFSNFDAFGRPRLVTDPNGNQTVLDYTARGLLQSRTDLATDALTSYDYDKAGKLRTVTLPLGNVVTVTQETNGKVKTITDQAGNQVIYDYDAMNKVSLVEIKDPQGALRRSMPQLFNNPSNPNWPGLLYRSQDPDSPATVFTEFDYDGNANLTKLVDRDNRQTDLVYDPLNQLTDVTQGVGTAVAATTSYRYDLHGNLERVIDGEGHTTTFENDDLGRVTTVDSPDTGVTRYVHDEAGNLVAKRDAEGNLVSYIYDAANRLKTILSDDGTIGFTYDELDMPNGIGRLTRVEDSSTGQTIRYDYDSLGRVKVSRSTLDGVTYQTGYEYDENGNLFSMLLPTGDRVVYDFDAAGRISKVRYQPVGAPEQVLAKDVKWMPFGPVSSWQYGNGFVASRAYDKQYRAKEVFAGNLSRSYTFSKAGDVLGIDLRFPEETAPPQTPRSYVYTPGTNRLSTIEPQADEDPVSLAFDPRGNVTSYGEKTFSYDALGRLEAVRVSGLTIATYAYDYRNHRTKKVAGGTTTIYHYDLTGNLVAETTETGTPKREYVYLGSELASLPLAMVSGSGSIYYYHVDHLGAPIKMSDYTGTTVWDAGYTPFGVASVNDDSDGDGLHLTSNLRLPGQYLDEETGLYQNWHRYYAPELGRYIQPDPIGFRGGTTNLYEYARNNPVKLTDPSGLWTIGLGIGTSGTQGGATVATNTQIVVDSSGNLGIATTTCGGGASEVASAASGVAGSVGNAPTIFDLQGQSLDVGLGLGVPGAGPGGSASITFSKDRCDKPTTTVNGFFGGQVGISPLDMTGTGCTTTVVPLL